LTTYFCEIKSTRRKAIAVDGEKERDKRCDDIDEELEIHFGRFSLLAAFAPSRTARREGLAAKGGRNQQQVRSYADYVLFT
jgi:hypothetical protein